MRSIARGWSVLLVLLLASPAWADARLTGVVLDREHGRPVAGAEISAEGANTVTTGNDGRFVLAFPEGHPGQDVTVRVNRSGWDVVSDILLDQRLPDHRNSRTLEIIICPRAECEQRKAEFYRLKGKEAVEQKYAPKLAELAAQQAATAQERDRLLRERDEALEKVKRLELEAQQAATAQERERLLRERDQLLAEQAKLAELERRQTATAQERDRLLRERDEALEKVRKLANVPDTRPGRIVGVTLVGAGIVSLGVGLGFGVSAASSWNDARHLGCDKAGTCPSSDGLQSVNTASSRAAWSNVLVPVGLGVGIVGMWITFRRSTKPSDESASQHVSIQFDGNSILVRGDF